MLRESYQGRKLKYIVFTSSPFLLAVVLKLHLEENKTVVFETLDRMPSTNVDNCVTSVSNFVLIKSFRPIILSAHAFIKVL